MSSEQASQEPARLSTMLIPLYLEPMCRVKRKFGAQLQLYIPYII